jgi:tetratricopeptide (TPR) repeat protein
VIAPAVSLARFSDELEELLIRFEDAWESGGPADLRAFCPPGPEPSFLLELVRIDVARRGNANLPIDVEHYRAAFPELVASPDASAQLASIVTEAGRSTGGQATADFMPAPNAVGPYRDPDAVTVTSAYAELRKHAQGGLGEVFVADDVSLGRRVALKTIRVGRSGSRRARRDFLREAEVTSRLEHPGVVPVHGVGQSPDGRPCYSMRFVEGQTLKDAIRRHHEASPSDPGQRVLAFRDLLSRFVAVCNTVAYAHSRGVLHRDLKPENIMLGPFGETLVLDWGLAKDLTKADGGPANANWNVSGGADVSDDGFRDGVTRTGDLIGTPAFMCPEQAAGDVGRIGTAADIFGLGATLYAILTGSPPYRDSSVEAILSKARVGGFVPPRKLVRTIPAALDAICRKAMAVEPGRRFGSAQDLARDVENWLAGERVKAWKEPWHVGVRRYLRRHRTLVAVATVLGVVLPIGFGVAAWVVAGERAKREIDRQTAEVKDRAAAETTDYLVKTFESADPLGLDAVGFRGAGERSDDTTIRRMLDGGAELLRTHMHDQPVRRASLLDAMGNSFRNLGDWDRARGLLQEAYDLRRSHLGADSAETLASMHSLARLAQDSGDYAEAARLYRAVIAGRERFEPPERLLVAQTKAHFAWMLFNQPLSLDRPQDNQANLKEADEVLQDVLKTREALLPPNHRDVGFTLAALASVKAVRGGQDLAVAILASRAIEVFRLSDQDSMLGNAMGAYLEAENHRRARRFAEADRIYVRILEVARRHLGPRHPMTVMHMANMAGMYRQAGDTAKLLPIARDALDAVRTLPAMRSLPVLVDAIIQYGDILTTQSPDDAPAVFAEALRFARERPPENAGNIQKLEQRIHDFKAPAPKK